MRSVQQDSTTEVCIMMGRPLARSHTHECYPLRPKNILKFGVMVRKKELHVVIYS